MHPIDTAQRLEMMSEMDGWMVMVVGLFLSRVRLPGTACATNCVNRC